MAFERFGGSETHLNNGGGGGYGGYGVREAPSVASLSSSATGSSRGTVVPGFKALGPLTAV